VGAGSPATVVASDATTLGDAADRGEQGVFCEKPLATNYEAMEMVGAVERAGWSTWSTSPGTSPSFIRREIVASGSSAR
jgi:hypothetical protein